MYATTDKRFHRITSTTAFHFCFILPKMSRETIIYLLLANQRRYIYIQTLFCCATLKRVMYTISFYYFTDHFLDLDSSKRVKGNRKRGEVAEPDKPAHRQLGVRPHHVCDESMVLAEYWIKDIEKIRSAMNEDFQNQFKMHMIKIRITSTERHTNC